MESLVCVCIYRIVSYRSEEKSTQPQRRHHRHQREIKRRRLCLYGHAAWPTTRYHIHVYVYVYIHIHIYYIYIHIACHYTFISINKKKTRCDASILTSLIESYERKLGVYYNWQQAKCAHTHIHPSTFVINYTLYVEILHLILSIG